jgi:hypothetical protein
MNNDKKILLRILLLSLFFPNLCLAQPDLEVNGIFYEQKGESYAIVNEKVVKVRSKLGEVEIIEIGNDFVKFQYQEIIFSKKVGEEVTSPKANQRDTQQKIEGWGGYQGKEHYDKAIELYKEGDGLRGNNNEKAFKILDEALAEARLSLRYDYVTKEMKSKLDSIITICEQYDENSRRSLEKLDYLDKARRKKTSEQKGQWKLGIGR